MNFKEWAEKGKIFEEQIKERAKAKGIVEGDITSKYDVNRIEYCDFECDEIFIIFDHHRWDGSESVVLTYEQIEMPDEDFKFYLATLKQKLQIEKERQEKERKS
jgi:hypothetical protein